MKTDRITERKRAEAALAESESHFRQIAEFLPQPAWISLPDGRCDYLSRRWAEFTGVPAAQQLDFGWLSQICPDDRDALMSAWKTAAAAGQTFQLEFRIRYHRGDYHKTRHARNCVARCSRQDREVARYRYPDP